MRKFHLVQWSHGFYHYFSTLDILLLPLLLVLMLKHCNKLYYYKISSRNCSNSHAELMFCFINYKWNIVQKHSESSGCWTGRKTPTLTFDLSQWKLPVEQLLFFWPLNRLMFYTQAFGIIDDSNSTCDLNYNASRFVISNANYYPY